MDTFKQNQAHLRDKQEKIGRPNNEEFAMFLKGSAY